MYLRPSRSQLPVFLPQIWGATWTWGLYGRRYLFSHPECEARHVPGTGICLSNENMRRRGLSSRSYLFSNPKHEVRRVLTTSTCFPAQNNMKRGVYLKPDRGSTGLRKRSQRNEPSFRPLAGPQSTKNERWRSENRRHYFNQVLQASRALHALRISTSFSYWPCYLYYPRYISFMISDLAYTNWNLYASNQIRSRPIRPGCHHQQIQAFNIEDVTIE